MEQALYLREHARERGWKVMVTNTSWERLPEADLLYSSDSSWWMHYWPKAKAYFKGELWTTHRGFAHKFHLYHIRHSATRGLSREYGLAYSGGNSGHVLVNMAYLFGAREILLVGYDFQDSYGMSHWHGDHPPTLNQQRAYPHWIAMMNSMAPELAKEGVTVHNCTIETALTCFPRKDLAECMSP